MRSVTYDGAVGGEVVLRVARPDPGGVLHGAEGHRDEDADDGQAAEAAAGPAAQAGDDDAQAAQDDADAERGEADRAGEVALPFGDEQDREAEQAQRDDDTDGADAGARACGGAAA